MANVLSVWSFIFGFGQSWSKALSMVSVFSSTSKQIAILEESSLDRNSTELKKVARGLKARYNPTLCIFGGRKGESRPGIWHLVAEKAL